MTAVAELVDARDALAFTLPPEREAHEPPEARGVPRDGVAMLVSRGAAGEISHHAFTELPSLLLPGDLLVVNASACMRVRMSPGSTHQTLTAFSSAAST